MRLREPVNGFTHLFSAILASAGLIILLILGQGNLQKEISLLIYGLSLVLMFTTSAVYHLLDFKPDVMIRLRKMDHTAIYLLIAGTYTPISYLALADPWRLGTLLVIWALALAGIAGKVFLISQRRWLYTLLYVLMGWLGVTLIGQLHGRLPSGALAWLVAGGAVYTLGAILYILKWPRLRPDVFGYHDLWHLLVIGGAACHYVVLLVYLAPLSLPT